MPEDSVLDFSVVVTAYNKKEFIPCAIESVLKQTCRNFEIIVVDDGSTDGTKDAVFSFRDSRIRYYYQENSGLPACARNRGMSLARGEYIALLDGDDYWHKDKLKECKEALLDNPEISVVCHNMAVIEDKVIRRVTDYGKAAPGLYERLLFQENCLNPSAVVLRSRISRVDKLRFSEENDLFTIEDYEYWLRLALNYKVHFLPDVLGFYRLNENGIFFQNIDTNCRNMLGLLDRHFGKYNGEAPNLKNKKKKRRSAVMCAAGRLHHHKNDFLRGRSWYAEAIREYPLNYKAYICFLAAFLNRRLAYK